MFPLPSKKIIILGFILLTIVVGIIFSLQDGEKNGGTITSTSTSAGGLTTSSSTLSALEQAVAKELASGKQYVEFDSATLRREVTAKDLKVSTKEDTDSLKAYALTIISIMKPYETPRENEARVLIRAIDYRDSAQFTNLRNIAALHALTVSKLLDVNVPKSAVTAHVALVNSTRKLAILVSNMSQGLEQPILALQSADTYIEENPLFFVAINDLNRYFNEKGIKLSDAEKINIYVNLDE